MVLNSKSTSNLVQRLEEEHKEIRSKIEMILNNKSMKQQSKQNIIRTIELIITRHLYLEEKIIYIYSSSNCDFNDYNISELIKQHNNLLNTIENAKKSISTNVKYDFNEFLQELSSHINYEKEHFYGEIEEILDENQSDIILKELNKDENLGYFPISKLRKYAAEKNLC